MKKLIRILTKFFIIPILENGLVGEKYSALEEYDKKVSRMNLMQLCTETGVSHRSFVENNLSIQDLKNLAMKSYCIKVTGSFSNLENGLAA